MTATKRTKYLFLDYLPANGRKEPRPALLCWFEEGSPRLYGTGVGEDGSFDPVAFAGAFPADAAEVWVFAEWAAAVREHLEGNDDRNGLKKWIANTPDAALLPGAEGLAFDAAALIPRLARGEITRESVAVEAFAYLLLTELPPSLSILRDSDKPSKRGETPDFRLVSSAGTVLANLEVKKRAHRTILGQDSALSAYPWHLLSVSAQEPKLVTALGAPDCRNRLQAWLATLQA